MLPSDTEYSDAKLLATYSACLTREEVRILYGILESGAHTPDSLDLLTSVGLKLEDALGDYYKQVEKLTEAARSSVLAGVSPGTAQQAVDVLIAQIDASLGQEECCDIIVTNQEHEWMLSRWRASANLAGAKSIRYKLLRIKAVLERPRGVKFQGGPAPGLRIEAPQSVT